MTDEEIDAMEAGREMDAKVHRALWPRHNIETGILRFQYRDGEHEKGTACQWRDIPHYSTDIGAAWQVVEKLKPALLERGMRWHLDVFGVERYGVGCVERYPFTKHFYTEADTMPLAICRAALKAVQQNYHEITTAEVIELRSKTG